MSKVGSGAPQPIKDCLDSSQRTNEKGEWEWRGRRAERVIDYKMKTLYISKDWEI